ncbi:dipeptidase [Arthrobacter sp. MYb23]|uniref:M20/M25/M40 family metallo-hydrolase n=1 Tax=unclassified Arthrobacter TaxID=235627 RepID=UPI000CFCCE36|nr:MULTISPECIES: M20/M25/M40 family metallo-hydrolase [unclassified Arthrobacter]PRB43064.1 dipeptidase [Arthrobacter sp. MYb51]PRB98016.1 dipeptidase [Arthrobacter sp. MYb23]
MNLKTTETLVSAVSEGLPMAIDLLAQLVAEPSVSGGAEQDSTASERTARMVEQAFRDVGISKIRLQETPDGSYTVIGCNAAAPDAPTVLLYSHYDIQPVGDRAVWQSEPYVLTELGARLYGRGAADCKGGIVTHVAALSALGPTDRLRIVVVCEGSEERGGTGLIQYMRKNPEEFRSIDVALIADAGNLSAERPALTISLRGLLATTIEISSGEAPLHSGLYGGAAPDALAALIAVLASMRDASGDTTIHGLPNDGRWKYAPYPAENFIEDARLLPGIQPVGTSDPASQIWAKPALTIMGIDVPSLDSAAPVIQSKARAIVNLRIPPGTDALYASQALEEHIHNHTPWGLEARVTHFSCSRGISVDTESRTFRAFAKALENSYANEVDFIGAGGSIPFCQALLEASPDSVMLLYGPADPLSHIHAANESVGVRALESTISAEVQLLKTLILETAPLGA